MTVIPPPALCLAFPREASSSRPVPDPRDVLWGHVSPSPGRRVHRGRSKLIASPSTVESRLPQGGEFIEARLAGGGAVAGAESRLPQGGEFIEATGRGARGRRGPSLAFPREASSSRRLTYTPRPHAHASSRLPQGGEFIEASARHPPTASPSVSPSPGRRVHRGGRPPRPASGRGRLAFPREASSSRRLITRTVHIT